MRKEALDREYTQGSGNVYRDLGYADAGIRQLKASLAARIVGVLDDRGLTVRAAEKLTGVSAADFSRIRNAQLGRFSADRLLKIAMDLGLQVQLRISGRRTAA